MTEDQFKKFEELLIAKADEFIAAGGSIINRAWISGDKCKCPISAACIGVSGSGSYASSFTSILGFKVSNHELWDFIDGFDCNDTDNDKPKHPELVELGRKLNKKYIKETK